MASSAGSETKESVRLIRLAADENFNGKVIDGLRQRLPDLNVIRIQDTAIYQAPDTRVLAWTASENRVLLTHDANTLIGNAYRRVEQGLAMPGVIEVANDLPIGSAIDELEYVISVGRPEDFADLVTYIPLR